MHEIVEILWPSHSLISLYHIKTGKQVLTPKLENQTLGDHNLLQWGTVGTEVEQASWIVQYQKALKSSLHLQRVASLLQKGILISGIYYQGVLRIWVALQFLCLHGMREVSLEHSLRLLLIQDALPVWTSHLLYFHHFPLSFLVQVSCQHALLLPVELTVLWYVQNIVCVCVCVSVYIYMDHLFILNFDKD